MATATFLERVGSAVREAALSKQSTWYTPFMAGASRAIAERIPLVDLVLDVRDARIPMSSEYEPLRCFPASKRIIALNKMDLVHHSHLKEWIRYFEGENYAAHGINSHNKDDTQKFLNFLQAQVRALSKASKRSTTTIMLVGIPNVGKSALANALHQVGRISAAEKGKLRHAVVSPVPGETKTIYSFKIASHPNIFILDTPGVLPSRITDAQVCAKLALTGAIRDCLAGEEELARYLLAVINSSSEYEKWATLFQTGNESSASDNELGDSELGKRQIKATPTDHTQDAIVSEVHRSLFEAISSFKGRLADENGSLRLIQTEIEALRGAFGLHRASYEDDYHKTALKLLNLYRTGRLGHYSLDNISSYQCHSRQT